VQAVPLGEALGAELVDFDITSRPSSNDQVELRRLFQRYHLLLVRGQPLSATDHDRFVACFGPLQSNRVGDDAGYVTNREHPKSLFGPDLQQLLWHLDGAYGPRPGIATSLWAEVVSPEAPPTLFANAVRGLRRMPPDLRSTAEQYRIQNVKDTAYDRTADRVTLAELVATDEPDRYVVYEHPLLFQPPHLDEKAVIASEHDTSHVVGVPYEQGEAFLKELFGLLYAADNVYAHRWQPHDVIIWDNIALQHARPAAVDSSPRHLRRQCIDGWYTDTGEVLDWSLSRVPSTGQRPGR
jgi:taurine dioxygenase